MNFPFLGQLPKYEDLKDGKKYIYMKYVTNKLK
jgi:hypothetical protein